MGKCENQIDQLCEHEKSEKGKHDDQLELTKLDDNGDDERALDDCTTAMILSPFESKNEDESSL